MKNKKLTGQQIRLIIYLFSIAVFAFCYLYVYTGYVKKTQAVHKETNIVNQDIKERVKKLSEEKTVDNNLKQVNTQIQDILDSYPVNIAKEDNFMFIEKLQEALDIQISSIDIKDSTIFYQTILPIRNADGTAETTDPQTMTGLQSVISMNFITTYDGFKELVDYINNYPDKTVIDSAAVSYDSTTGNLTGSLVIKRYALTGTGKVYEPPYINDISIGTDNIFGTGKKP
jgi:hypothetical protein